ncbi:hypothetical protein HMI54_006557, partial [Coelomomyces lativittatus]
SAEDSPRFKNLTIVSFLILPIQRVPRYILLLEQLLKFTSPDHPDYLGLQKCVDEVKHIAEHINDAIRKFELQTKVVQLQAYLHGRPDSLVTPARRFVEELECWKCTRNGVVEKRCLLVFNDLVMLTKKINEQKYDFKLEFNLNDPTVLFHEFPVPLDEEKKAVAVELGEDKKLWGIQCLSPPNESMVLFFGSFEVRDRIYQHIMHQVHRIRSSGLTVEISRARSLSPIDSKKLTSPRLSNELISPRSPISSTLTTSSSASSTSSTTLATTSFPQFMSQLGIFSQLKATLKRKKKKSIKKWP